jgi:hypothetical protein
LNPAKRAPLLAGLAALAAFALAGCAGQQIAGNPPRLLLTVYPPSPAQLDPGTLVSVTAQTEPRVAMQWVSGTVRILGAPVTDFRPLADGSWGFTTMVPPMVNVPPGTYHIRAWGRSMDGEDVRGELTYEVE